jgi:hypothetical protein
VIEQQQQQQIAFFFCLSIAQWIVESFSVMNIYYYHIKILATSAYQLLKIGRKLEKNEKQIYFDCFWTFYRRFFNLHCVINCQPKNKSADPL